MINPDDIPADMVITMQDIRDTGHCVAGIRDWFGANDLNFRAFLKPGASIPARQFAAYDALSEAVVLRKMNLDG